MRNIAQIIIHCSATKEGKDFDVKNIRDWHVNGNGWSDIGYHYVIKLNGTIQEGRPENKIGAHAKGNNRYSIGICYIGGLDINGKSKDTRTEKQKESLIKLIKEIKETHKEATVYGHNDFSSKDCPCFNAKKEYEKL